jgi:hypothetical protein
MSQLGKIIDNMKLDSTVELEPYHFRVNGENLDWNTRTSTCEIDTDGDLVLDFQVEVDDLLNIIDDEDIIAYLENSGYRVEEE